MPGPDSSRLVQLLVPPLDHELVAQIALQFMEMGRRFVLGDWGPSELDGGKFCEAVARAICAVDCGVIDRERRFGECVNILESGNRGHNCRALAEVRQIIACMKPVYDLRNKRGVAHLSLTYSSNEMDARYVLDSCRWILSELIRVFSPVSDRERIAAAVRELLHFEVPAIADFGGRLLVQRTDLSVEQEVLLLLHHTGEKGMTRADLGRNCMAPPSSISDALKRLSAPNRREIILHEQCYCLTGLGNQRVSKEMGALLQREAA